MVERQRRNAPEHQPTWAGLSDAIKARVIELTGWNNLAGSHQRVERAHQGQSFPDHLQNVMLDLIQTRQARLPDTDEFDTIADEQAEKLIIALSKTTKTETRHYRLEEKRMAFAPPKQNTPQEILLQREQLTLYFAKMLKFFQNDPECYKMLELFRDSHISPDHPDIRFHQNKLFSQYLNIDLDKIELAKKRFKRAHDKVLKEVKP